MSRVIEILDSDDDDVADVVEEMPVQQQQIQQATMENPNNAMEASPSVVQHIASSPNKSTRIAESSSIPSTATSLPANQATELPAKSRSRHSRKSTHQHMRASPDMQFETITLDDEDDDIQPNATDSATQASKPTGKAAKFFKNTPNILGTKQPTAEEQIETDFNEFLASDEITAKIQRIAEERIRINFLLASYGMPDISFSLNTSYERLKFQFEDRVKQRKMRNWNRLPDEKTKKNRAQDGANSIVPI